VIQITHRLTLSAAAAVELTTGLNATLKALRQAQEKPERVVQELGHA
jgi:hypothetical protein